MREIKFRAWDKSAETMLPVEQWANRSWVAVPIQVGEEEWELNQLKLEDVEIMQFTGLLDKNGVEIYEGDILEFVSPAVEALSAEARALLPEGSLVHPSLLNGRKELSSFLEVKIPDIYIAVWCGSDVEYSEVVGNIYENPEPLKN